MVALPWLVWLSGLSTSLQAKGSLVRFPVRAHAWVAGQVPCGGVIRGRQSVYLSHMHPSLGTWPTTQACALTGNRTSDPLVRRLALNPLSHTSQARYLTFNEPKCFLSII